MKYLAIGDFLCAEDNSNLINYTKNNTAYFLERTTSPDYPNQKALGAMKGFENWKGLVVNKVRLILPEVLKMLSIKPFEVASIESDASAHADGGFLGMHDDIFPKSSRVLSFVYYYHSLPRKFTGGQLVIYDFAELRQFIEPNNNSIVFFPSYLRHEVLPVVCGGKHEARFSINGWINQ